MQIGNAVRVIVRAMPRARQRTYLAVALWLAATVVFFVTMPGERLRTHTPFNHFALLAQAWREGRLDLANGAPDYAGGNDFAVFGDKVFVSFPPFPAVVLLPFVWLAGSAEAVRDGLVFVLLAGLAPAFTFLALERFVDVGRSTRTLRENLALAIVFAFGTVFWFTAVQGTVWFAAHVVGAALLALFVFASVGAERPILAGVALGLGLATRTPIALAGAYFLFELFTAAEASDDRARGRAVALRKLTAFAIPVAAVLALLAWHNAARFGDPFEFGHRYLAIAWRDRIDRYGLFSLHYLGKNLGVVLASLPFSGGPGPDAAPFRVNAHGLALWITSPFYLCALLPRPLPRARRRTVLALSATALAIFGLDLCYQNTGWIQFGYRFSNDFAIFVFAVIALRKAPLRWPFWTLCAIAIAVNAFGALTFQRAGFERFYYVDGTQRVVFDPD